MSSRKNHLRIEDWTRRLVQHEQARAGLLSSLNETITLYKRTLPRRRYAAELLPRLVKTVLVNASETPRRGVKLPDAPEEFRRLYERPTDWPAVKRAKRRKEQIALLLPRVTPEPDASNPRFAVDHLIISPAPGLALHLDTLAGAAWARDNAIQPSRPGPRTDSDVTVDICRSIILAVIAALAEAKRESIAETIEQLPSSFRCPSPDHRSKAPSEVIGGLAIAVLRDIGIAANVPKTLARIVRGLKVASAPRPKNG